MVEDGNPSGYSLAVYRAVALATGESLQAVCTMREEERNALIQVLGIKYLRKNQSSGDERLKEVEKRIEVERQRLRETEERLRETEERLVCLVCATEEVGMAFSPCGHTTCCPTCAPRVTSCPTCRAKVDRIIRVYIK